MKRSRFTAQQETTLTPVKVRKIQPSLLPATLPLFIQESTVREPVPSALYQYAIKHLRKLGHEQLVQLCQSNKAREQLCRIIPFNWLFNFEMIDPYLWQTVSIWEANQKHFLDLAWQLYDDIIDFAPPQSFRQLYWEAKQRPVDNQGVNQAQAFFENVLFDPVHWYGQNAVPLPKQLYPNIVSIPVALETGILAFEYMLLLLKDLANRDIFYQSATVIKFTTRDLDTENAVVPTLVQTSNPTKPINLAALMFALQQFGGLGVAMEVKKFTFPEKFLQKMHQLLGENPKHWQNQLWQLLGDERDFDRWAFVNAFVIAGLMPNEQFQIEYMIKSFNAKEEFWYESEMLPLPYTEEQVLQFYQILVKEKYWPLIDVEKLHMYDTELE